MRELDQEYNKCTKEGFIQSSDELNIGKKSKKAGKKLN